MKHIAVLFRHLSSVFILISSLLNATISFGQMSEARVRAALVFNFAQNIEWENEQELSSYRIGVFCTDTSLLNEFELLEQRFQIRNKPIEVEHIKDLSGINDLQILYVEGLFNQDISDVYSSIKGKRTLLITDRCPYKLFIMINLLFDFRSRTLSYEINRQNIENENFKLKPEILVHGGSYIDIKQLYTETYQQLKVETQKISEFQQMLEAIKYEKDSFQVQANLLNNQINELMNSKLNIEKEHENLIANLNEKDSILRIRTKELNNKVAESHVLQKDIQHQLDKINSSTEQLSLLNKEIEIKQAELDEKQKSIDEQKAVLSEQETVIEVQQKFLLVSIALAVSLFLALFMAYRAYRTKKQVSIKLEKLVDERTKELQLSREYFKNLFESSPVPICEMDLSKFYAYIKDLGKTLPQVNSAIENNTALITQAIKLIKINDANSAILNLFGYKTKKEFFDNYIKSYNNQSIRDFQKSIEHFIQKQEKYSYETVRQTSTGELKYLQISWIVLPGFLSNYGRVIVTMTDVTELKLHRDHLEELVNIRSKEVLDLNKELTETVEELENTVQMLQQTQGQLIRSEKMASLGMLTAGIAHEINNPINYISASTQAFSSLLQQISALLNERKEEETKSSENTKSLGKENIDELTSSIKFLLENIETGVKRTTEIISSLMTYSRTGEMVFAEYDLISGIKNTLVILRSKFANRIAVIEEYDSVPKIVCNSSSINQLLMNLISNAIDAIPDKGTINISLTHKSKSNELLLKVKDSGIGIAEETKVKIFDPFFTTKQVGKGTGLGLYITYGIVQQHGGRIEVNSKVGEGSEFSVYLPVQGQLIKV